MRAMNDRKAFTLIEVVVILAVITILAAIAIPMALRLFQVTAEQATRDEMDNLKKAMIGDPQKLQSSFRSSFGFLGDIGCLPTVLDRLLTASGLPTPYSFDSVKQAGAGWNGPYITGSVGEIFTKDQWGNDYTYAPVGGGCPLTATLTSNGQDGTLSTSDDIILSIGATDTTATTVRGTVKDTAGVLLEAVPVEFYSPSSGTLTTTTNFPPGTDVNGNYVFSSVPFGPRAVKARPNFVYTPGSATGGTNIITFRILNYAEADVQITHMRVSWPLGLGIATQFNRIRIDLGGGPNTVYGAGVGTPPPPVGPGTVVTLGGVLGNRTVAASPTLRPSARVFIDSTDVKLPDTTITGGGTLATIDIRFVGGSGIMPAGTPITVTFNPQPPSVQPLSIVKFTTAP